MAFEFPAAQGTVVELRGYDAEGKLVSQRLLKAGAVHSAEVQHQTMPNAPRRRPVADVELFIAQAQGCVDVDRRAS